MTIVTEKTVPIDRAEEPVPTWQAGSWETFLTLSQQPIYQKAKTYYFRGAYQFVMGVGANHAAINLIISLLVELYCIVRGIPFRGLTNASYRKAGLRECQPDSSFYFGDSVNASPTGREIANLDNYSPPDLVIEIADSSLADDLGMKRLLYEEMQVREYWVIDVQTMKIIAFQILDSLGSIRITESLVIAGLQLSFLEEALSRSSELDNSQLGAWFMEQIKENN